MISITLPNGEIWKVEKGTCALDIIKQIKDKFATPIMEAIVNNVQTDLQYPLDKDCTLDFIKIDSELGMRVYVNTLLFMFLTAAKRRYPHVKMEVRNTLGSALYIKFAENKLTNEEVLNLQFNMKDLVQKKVPINLITCTKEECMAMEIDPVCDADRKVLISNAPAGTPIYMYELLGNKAFFFGKLAPNCGYCTKFELFPFDEGVILNYPSHHMWHDLESFEENKKIVHDVFQESNEWAHAVDCGTIASFNKQIEQGANNRMILIAEALHEKKIIAMADKIASQKDKVKLVLIAGPSSSGKTSTCQRLTIHLAVNGLKAIPISMDDYYVEREKTPRKPDGGYDFECVEAIDLPLFNEQMEKLLAGESVRLPKFNFKSGKREWKDGEFKLKEGEILLVEGIHGLNDRLTSKIPAENKIKVYVSALTPMSLDNYNRINTTDVRLMRRMVRDNQFRSHDALHTLAMWDDVREGEEKYIFPFQPYADIVFNTTLIYELAVLKKYAEPLLKAVPIDSGKPYMTAQRLLLLLSFINEIDDGDIPNNSILREFVGGSVFRDAL